MMTYEKALEFGNELFITNKVLKMTFREQAFLNLALTAIEKQIPKKPIKHEFPLNSTSYDCPICSHTVCDKRHQHTDKQYCEESKFFVNNPYYISEKCNNCKEHVQWTLKCLQKLSLLEDKVNCGE